MVSAQEQQRLNQAISLQQQCNFKAADQLYQLVLSLNPNQIDALHMLGVSKFQQGQPKPAERFLKRALKKSPKDPWIAYHYAELLSSVGKFSNARRLYEQAIRHGANDSDALYGYANALFELREFSKAKSIYTKALKLNPDDNDCRQNMANTLEELGEHHAAVDCLQPLIQKNSKSVLTRLQLIELYLNTYQYEQARKLTQTIKHIAQSEFDAVISTAKRLCRAAQVESSRHLVDQLLNADSAPNVKETDQLAGLMIDLKLYHQALSLVTNSTKSSNTRTSWSWFQEGLCAQIQGSFEEAASCHMKALACDPSMGVSAYSLATNGAIQITDDQLEIWNNLRQSPSINPKQKSYLTFAIAQTLDKRGQHDNAFQCYAEANKISFDSNPFDSSAWDAYIQDLMNTFSADFFVNWDEEIANSNFTNDATENNLVYIVGMPRSGSTLLEQLLIKQGAIGLGEHYGMRQIISEVPEITGFKHKAPTCAADLTSKNVHELRQRYVQSFKFSENERASDLAQSGAIHVDKMLGNFVRLGVLAMMFPKATIFNCCRDPRALAVSCFTNAFTDGMRFTYNLNTLGRYYTAYQTLMNHWRRILPVNIIDIHYEALVTNPDGYLDKQIEAAGLSFKLSQNLNVSVSDSSNSAPIHTASFWQARQPVSTQPIEHWKRFENHLDELYLGLNYQ